MNNRSIKWSGAALALLTFALIAAAYVKMLSDSFDQTEVESDESITAELYYFSACESCHEDRKFEYAIRKRLKDAGAAQDVACVSYNAFQERERRHMEKRMAELGETLELSRLPVVVLDGILYYGTYDEIGLQVGTILSRDEADTSLTNLFALPDENDTVFLLFTTYACESCVTVKDFLKEGLPEQVMVSKDGQQIVSSVRIMEYNVMEEKNLELLNTLIARYHVPDRKQQVPILFFQEGYLSGKKEICGNIVETAKSGGGLKFDIDLLKGWQAGDEEVRLRLPENFHTELPGLILTGLINGLNPCAVSMLFMILSVLLLSDRHFLKGGLTYIAGKLLAYFMMGLCSFKLFQFLQETVLGRIERGIEIFFAIVAFALFVLNLWDFQMTRKKNYGKIIVQLPEKLRKCNHRLIERLKTTPSSMLLPVIFLLGLVVSAGEFFCTGQLYVASILTLVRKTEYGMSLILVMLVIYILAMCFPSVIMILVIGKTKNLLAVSRFTLSGMPVVKLMYAFLFGIMFLILLFF